MDLAERCFVLMIGMAIGFVAGYIVRALREIRDDQKDIKEELHEVDTIVKTKLNGDDGFMGNRLVADVLMIVVVLIVAGSALLSQKAVNESSETQNCTVDFLTQTIAALNERTTYSEESTRLNVELQKAQADFLTFIFRQPPYPENARRDAAQEYLRALTNFVEISAKEAEKFENNPYPTSRELNECLS